MRNNKLINFTVSGEFPLSPKTKSRIQEDNEEQELTQEMKDNLNLTSPVSHHKRTESKVPKINQPK